MPQSLHRLFVLCLLVLLCSLCAATAPDPLLAEEHGPTATEAVEPDPLGIEFDAVTVTSTLTEEGGIRSVVLDRFSLEQLAHFDFDLLLRRVAIRRDGDGYSRGMTPKELAVLLPDASLYKADELVHRLFTELEAPRELAGVSSIFTKSTAPGCSSFPPFTKELDFGRFCVPGWNNTSDLDPLRRGFEDNCRKKTINQSFNAFALRGTGPFNIVHPQIPQKTCMELRCCAAMDYCGNFQCNEMCQVAEPFPFPGGHCEGNDCLCDLNQPPDQPPDEDGGTNCDPLVCNNLCKFAQGDGQPCSNTNVECGVWSCPGGSCSNPDGSCLCSQGPCSCTNIGCDPEPGSES